MNRTYLSRTLSIFLIAAPAFAQTAEPTPKAVESASCGTLQTETFTLNNVSQHSDADEIRFAIAGTLGHCATAILIPSQNVIVVEADLAQLAAARKLITELDRPRKTYRLTYTVTELDAAKRIGTQHFSMVVVTGQRTTLKQGSKIPVITGSYSPSNASAGTQNQFTYIDVGMNFAAQLDETEHGARLNSKVEQSSVGEEKAIADAQEPVIRQTVLEGTSFLTLNQPLMLGSLDILGTTRRLDIEVTMEKVQ
jgi:type II secretory pathway component GspD/PulD (secretin)